MKRGQEFTDYINASFIDVSIKWLFYKVYTLQLFAILTCLRVCHAGVQTEGLFHRDAGSSVTNGGGFLEDGLGVEVSLDRNADRTTGARSGTNTYNTNSSERTLLHDFQSKLSHHFHISCVLQDKCFQYWPSENSVTYGDFSVEIKGDTLCDTFSLKDLLLTYGPVSFCLSVWIYNKYSQYNNYDFVHNTKWSNISNMAFLYLLFAY